MNPETCLPYTDKDNILEGTEDKYSDEVVHKKSKIYDSFDVFYKKYVQEMRKYFLEGKTKGSSKRGFLEPDYRLMVQQL